MKHENTHTGTHEVASLEELLSLVDLRPWRWLAPTKNISLQILFITSTQQRVLERRLNLWRGVCGCTAGALLVLVSLAWYIEGPLQEFDSAISAVLYGVGLVIATGMLGKVLTVLFARLMFYAEVNLFVWQNRHNVQQRRSTR